MSVPKSVIKFKKGTIEYVSSVDHCQYTIQELSRAALRDVGKMLARYANNAASSQVPHVNRKRMRGNTSPFQYWVRKKETDLQVGVEHTGYNDEWYGVSQELGTSGMPKLAILTNTARDHLEDIRNIEAQYLTALQADDPDLSGTNEDDYEGGGE